MQRTELRHQSDCPGLLLGAGNGTTDTKDGITLLLDKEVNTFLLKFKRLFKNTYMLILQINFPGLKELVTYQVLNII